MSICTRCRSLFEFHSNDLVRGSLSLATSQQHSRVVAVVYLFAGVGWLSVGWEITNLCTHYNIDRTICYLFIYLLSQVCETPSFSLRLMRNGCCLQINIHPLNAIHNFPLALLKRHVMSSEFHYPVPVGISLLETSSPEFVEVKTFNRSINYNFKRKRKSVGKLSNSPK